MITAEVMTDPRKSSRGYAVKIRVYHQRKYYYLPTGIYQTTKRLKQTQDVLLRIGRLKKEVAYIQSNNLEIDQALTIIRNGVPDTEKDEIEELKRRLRELQRKSGASIYDFWPKFIDMKKGEGIDVKQYEETLKHLQGYTLDDDLTFNEISREWLLDFIDYRRRLGTGQAGINYYLKGLRAVYLEGQRRDSLEVKAGNPFKGLIKETTKKVKPYLSYEELGKLLAYQPNKNTTKPNRAKLAQRIDLFLFSILIGGHDFADVALLKWSDIRNGRVIFQRHKNRNKKEGGAVVNNLLCPEAKAIIDKHGTKKDKRVFSFIPDPVTQATRYGYFRDNYSRALMNICDDLKLSYQASSKTPRYLFRTYAGFLEVDLISVMAIQGHSSANVSFNYQSTVLNTQTDKNLLKVVKVIFAKK